MSPGPAAGMVNARFGGHAIPAPALVVAPALMAIAIILFTGTVSGAPRGIGPLGLSRHPNLTLTAADPDRLAAAVRRHAGLPGS
jgi:hypothetical protein